MNSQYADPKKFEASLRAASQKDILAFASEVADAMLASVVNNPNASADEKAAMQELHRQFVAAK